jgi:type IV secretory pathway TraG/TraD family ATPase VirD4
VNLPALVLLAVFTLGARLAWRRGARLIALGCLAAASLFAVSVWRTTHPAVLAVLALAVLGLVWHRSAATSATVTRWGSTIRRKSGVASGLDIARHRGGIAMRRRAATLRPSLHAAGRRARLRQLLRLPVAEVAVRLCAVGFTTVWAAIEEVVLVFGGPRRGKTQWLAGQVIDAPGAVIATSTRTDLLDQTGPLRARRGPVFVFNPVGLGDRPSTVTFDPLIGCADPVTAAERATDMLAATGHGYHAAGGDREFWDDQGRRNLAALLHAAALAGDLTMADVQSWLADLPRHQAQITGLLRNQSPEPQYVHSVTQFIETNERTRSSITATISPALAWLTHKPAQAAALPGRCGGQPLDIHWLLASGGTVYMLGGEEHQVAPLVCAMTGWIAREARRLAAFCPGGRLDPPLSLRLDEAALICPIPLHQWTADMGGRGVSIVACFQSRAQVVDRYGDAKTATIINNSGARVLFGGTGDRDDLTYWSTLAGERDEPITTTDLHGRVASRTTRRVPVLAPAQLATLRPGRVVVFTSTIPPVVGRAEQAFRRFDVRAHHTPQAWSVRARIWLTRTAVPWLRRAAVPAAGALGGLYGGMQLGARAARNVDWAPAWVLVVVGGLAGAMFGLSCLRVLVAGWRCWRQPVAAWLAIRCSAAGRRLIAWWSTARRWRARRRVRVDYQPFPRHAPVRTHGGADHAEPPVPHTPLFGDPDA